MDVGLVCDTCSTFNPMGVKVCTRCSEQLSLDPPKGGTQAAKPTTQPATDNGLATSLEADVTRVGGLQMTMPASIACPTCGEQVPAGHTFCGSCGSRVTGMKSPRGKRTEPIARSNAKRPGTRPARRTQFFGAMQASRAKLVVIRGDGMDGISFTLAGEEHMVGRSDNPIQFEDDIFISPVHANFLYEDGNLIVRDENSINGVYMRIQGTITIEFGARFLVGEQLLEVEAHPDNIGPQPTDDGTYFFTSPPRPAYFRIVQRLLGGHPGMLRPAREPELHIGREDNDINFPDDPFISGRHARLAIDGEQLTLTDLDSKNGTFLRIDQQQILKHGDYVFMGQQLLRVEIV